MRPTWLGVEDLPDTPNAQRDIEGEQADRMKDILGVPLWEFLVEETDKWRRIITKAG